MRKAKTAIVATLLTAAGACASPRMPPAQLRDAREAMNKARESKDADYVLADIHKAQTTLDRAEASWRDKQDASRTDDLAYVAQRKAELAEVRGHNLALVAQKTDDDAQRERSLVENAERNRSEMSEKDKELAVAQAKEKDAAQQPQERGQSVGQDTMLFSSSVFFASGKDDLSPESERRLIDMTAKLASVENARVSIHGHSDASGPHALNVALSKKRAERVKDFLASRGLSTHEIHATGKGAEHSVADNGSAEGRASNRRADIVVHASAQRGME